jgi:hypothetical protein
VGGVSYVIVSRMWRVDEMAARRVPPESGVRVELLLWSEDRSEDPSDVYYSIITGVVYSVGV